MLSKRHKIGLSTDQRLDLILSCSDLSVGEGHYDHPCPVCGEKGSFSITMVSGGILYNCFRVTCGVRGLVRTTIAGPGDVMPGKKLFQPKTYMYDSQELSESWKKHFAGKYGITYDMMEKNGWTTSAESERLLTPFNSYYGKRFGLGAKKLPGSSFEGSKSVKYLEEESINLHFPLTNPTNNGMVVIVEDVISAVKVSQIENACALLGTNLSADQALFLAERFDHVVYALDPDAAMKAVWMLEKYKGVFKKSSVIFLEKDPKDSKLIVIQENLKGVGANESGTRQCDC